MCIVVDDFAITGDNLGAITKVKQEIMITWDCTDFKYLDWFIKINVSRQSLRGK